MINLSPEKRNQMVLLIVAPLAVCVIIWTFAIKPLNQRLTGVNFEVDQSRRSLELAEAQIRLADRSREDLATATTRLAQAEEKMAQGDYYIWEINSTGASAENTGLNIRDWDEPVIGEIEFPPRLADYKAASCVISGSGEYQDIGAFLAAFENSSPFVRFKRLSIDATAPGLTGIETEPDFRLSFRADFTVIAKPPDSGKE